jgi:hypothetical protein
VTCNGNKKKSLNKKNLKTEGWKGETEGNNEEGKERSRQ